MAALTPRQQWMNDVADECSRDRPFKQADEMEGYAEHLEALARGPNKLSMGRFARFIRWLAGIE